MDSKRTVPLQTPDPCSASTIKYENSLLHPVAAIEASSHTTELAARRKLQAAVYGAAFPMRRMMQRQTVAQFHRLAGLPSSNLALELFNRTDERIDFADYLDVETPDLPETEPREQLEKDMGLFVKTAL